MTPTFPLDDVHAICAEGLEETRSDYEKRRLAIDVEHWRPRPMPEDFR